MKYMSGHNRRKHIATAGFSCHLVKLLILLTLVFLASCGSHNQSSDVAALIAEGVIMPPGSISEADAVRETQHDLYEARRGNIKRDVNIIITARFTVTQGLSFTEAGGVFYHPLITEAGARVQAGDIIAMQVLPDSEIEAHELERNRLAFDIEQFESRTAAEQTRMRREISQARTAHANTGGEVTRLELARLELLYQRFLQEIQQTRQDFNEQLESWYLPHSRISTPFDGVVTSITQPSYGSSVVAGISYFLLADEASLEFTAIGQDEVIRYGNTFMVEHEMFSFEGRVVSDPLVLGDLGQLEFTVMPTDYDAFIEMVTALDLTLYDLTRMSFSANIAEILAYDVLIVPNTAIRREDRVFYVLIYQDGRYLKRYVTRGLVHLREAEILSGVLEGQMVVLP